MLTAFDSNNMEISSQCERKTYQLPYSDMGIGRSPKVIQMRGVVVQQAKRPPINADWSKDAITNGISKIMELCWSDKAEERPSSSEVLSKLGSLTQCHSVTDGGTDMPLTLAELPT